MNTLILKRLIGSLSGPALGPELVVNGDFSVGVGWSVPAGATISDGALNCAAASGWLYRTGVNIVTGKTYRLQFDMSDYVSGSARVYIQISSIFGAFASSNGHHSSDIVCTAGGAQEIGMNLSSLTAKIDNLSIKEVL